jgi:hypothetical protein
LAGNYSGYSGFPSGTPRGSGQIFHFIHFYTESFSIFRFRFFGRENSVEDPDLTDNTETEVHTRTLTSFTANPRICNPTIHSVSPPGS